MQDDSACLLYNTAGRIFDNGQSIFFPLSFVGHSRRPSLHDILPTGIKTITCKISERHHDLIH